MNSCILSTLVLTVCLLCHAPFAVAAEKPDVLFIAIDDMNDWTTLFHKNNPIPTPNLERLAAMGTFFNQAYCSASGCGPSRGSLMTGYRPTTLKLVGNTSRWFDVKPDAVTLPDYFRNNGYVAKGAGKIEHHGWNGGDDPRNHSKYGKGGYSWDEFQKLNYGSHPRKQRNGYTKEISKALSSVIHDWGAVADPSMMGDEVMLAKVCDYMDEKSDKPRFYAAGIYRPHLPFYAPQEIFDRFPSDEVVMPEIKEDDRDDLPPAALRMGYNKADYMKTLDKPASDPGSHIQMVRSYQAAAHYADTVVGRLLDKLESTGRMDNTIIVLWSDHGYHLGDKGNFIKFTLWEKANRTPYIIVAPGITTPGTVCDTPVSLLDLYPTLLELAGLPPNPENEGLSLVPLLKDVKADWAREAVLNTWGDGNHGLRSKQWRYTRYKDGSEELYDHSKDPHEWTNLATNPEYASVIAQHKTFMDNRLTGHRNGAEEKGHQK